MFKRLLVMLIASLLLVACEADTEETIKPTIAPLPDAIAWQTPLQPITPINAADLHLAGALEAHQGTIYQTLAQDDRYLTIGGDQQLIIWDMATGEAIFQVVNTDVKQAFFLPDGDRLITIDGRDQIIKWSIAEQQALETLQLDQVFTATALSPDGEQLVIGSLDGSITVYETETLAEQQRFQAHEGGFQVITIYFSPDAASIYTVGGGGTISRWRLADGEFMQHLLADYPPPLATAISPDRAVLAVAKRRELAFYDLQLGNLIRTVETPFKDLIGAMVFSPDGAWLALGGDHDAVMIYAVASGDVIAALPDHGQQFDDLAFSPQGDMLLTSASDQGVFLWDLQSLHNRQSADAVQVPRAPLNQVPGLQIFGVDWLPNGQQIVLIDARSQAYVLAVTPE